MDDTTKDPADDYLSRTISDDPDVMENTDPDKLDDEKKEELTGLDEVISKDDALDPDNDAPDSNNPHSSGIDEGTE